MGEKILDREINEKNFQLKTAEKTEIGEKISNQKDAVKNSVGRWVEKIVIICEKILSPRSKNL